MKILPICPVYQDDIEGLWVFIYKKGNYYYIPSEIKTIIKKEFNV